MLPDKDSLNKALSDSCNELKAKIENMKEAAEQSAILQEKLNQLKKEHEKVIQKQSNFERQIQQERTVHERLVSELK